ncbi:MAG TPA: nucleotide-binding domain containing protein, partial [Bauldia sp.]|nr:nucleotide-binding domain containing protein [Bauldia sp.]
VTGGSGIALGLPENFRKAGLLRGGGAGFATANGPGVVLSGSCSIASRGQVAAHLAGHPGLAVAPDALMRGDITVDSAVAFVRDNLDKAPIVYSTAEPEAVRAAQDRFGRETVAAAIEGFFGDVAARLVDAGVTRIAVGGGETSGAVVTALGVASLRIGPEIDPGVPALVADGRKPVHLALKSGNFGAPDFYAKALGVMGGA